MNIYISSRNILKIELKGTERFEYSHMFIDRKKTKNFMIGIPIPSSFTFSKIQIQTTHNSGYKFCGIQYKFIVCDHNGPG